MTPKVIFKCAENLRTCQVRETKRAGETRLCLYPPPLHFLCLGYIPHNVAIATRYSHCSAYSLLCSCASATIFSCISFFAVSSSTLCPISANASLLVIFPPLFPPIQFSIPTDSTRLAEGVYSLLLAVMLIFQFPYPRPADRSAFEAFDMITLQKVPTPPPLPG